MRTFENEEFTAFHDVGGNVYEDIAPDFDEGFLWSVGLGGR